MKWVWMMGSTLWLPIATTQALAQGSEARVGVGVLSTRQNVFAGQTLSQGSASLTAADFLVRGDLAGLYGRYITGTVGTHSFRGIDGRLRMAELRFMVGPPIFSVEAGLARRARAGSLANTPDKLVRFGVRSSALLGNSGFTVSAGAGAYGRSDSTPSVTKKQFGLVGWEAVTGVFYQIPHGIPLYVSLGYRYERIRSEKDFPSFAKEELSSVQLGAGFRYMGRSKPRQTAPTAGLKTP
jgi:hypothetical protein